MRKVEADVPRELSAGFVKVPRKKSHTMAKEHQWRSAIPSFLRSQKSILHARYTLLLELKIHQRTWWTQKLALKEERGGRQ